MLNAVATNGLIPNPGAKRFATDVRWFANAIACRSDRFGPIGTLPEDHVDNRRTACKRHRAWDALIGRHGGSEGWLCIQPQAETVEWERIDLST